MTTLRQIGTIAVIVAAVVCANAGPARAQTDLRRAFDRILQNPGDAQANFAYARLAEEQGKLRKSLAAYERVLLNDPENEEARRGLRRIMRALEPERFTATAILGAQYESNPRHVRNSGGDTDDGTFSARLGFKDERRIGTRRWRSEGELFANIHAEFGEIDFGRIGASTGPVLDFVGDWRVRPAVGLAFAWLDGEVLFLEATLLANFQAGPEGALRGVDFRVSYDNIGGEFSSRDGVIVELSPVFVFPNLATAGDAVVLRPLYRYNGGFGGEPNPAVVPADIFPLRYHQVGASADYFVPLIGRVHGGVGFKANYRFHNGRAAGETKKRRDFYIAPGVQLIAKRAFHGSHDLVLSYRYERNVSNAGAQNFENHLVGIQSVWRLQ